YRCEGRAIDLLTEVEPRFKEGRAPKPDGVKRKGAPLERRHVDTFADAALQSVTDADEGEKHNAVFKAGCMLGSVAHVLGLTNRRIANQILARVADTAKDRVAARKAALDGIATGRQEPRDIVDDDDAFKEYLKTEAAAEMEAVGSLIDLPDLRPAEITE